MRDEQSQRRAAPQAKNLNELLQYQDESVVSRVLLKNDAGNVTLFAFDQGQGLSEHTAPFDAWVMAIEGKAEIEISKQKYSLQEGQTITLPANQPHAVRAESQFKMLLVMIKS